MTLGQFKAALAVLDKRYRFPVLHYAGGEVAGRVSFHPEVDYNGLLEVKDERGRLTIVDVNAVVAVS